MAFFVVFTALVFWAAIFAIFFTSQGTSALEFLLGRYEAPPEHLNTWRESRARTSLGPLAPGAPALSSRTSGWPRPAAAKCAIETRAAKRSSGSLPRSAYADDASARARSGASD